MTNEGGEGAMPAVGGGGTAGGNGGTDGGDPAACVTDSVDIPTAIVTGTITVAGGTLTANYGNLLLSNGDDTVTLGATDSGTYSVRAVPGTYDVVYVGKQNGTHPLGTSVTIAASGTTTFDIDVPAATTTAPSGDTNPLDPTGPMFTVSGKVLVNGEELLSGYSGLALFQRPAPFVQRYSWQQVTPIDSAGTFRGQISPGTYDFTCIDIDGVENTGGSFPQNVMAVLLAGVVVDKDVDVNIDVPSTAITGTVTLNGGDGTNTTVGLSSPTLGGATVHASGTPGTFAAQVIPGTYDVVFSRSGAGPQNPIAVLQRGVEVSAAGDTVIEVDVQSVDVSGKLTIDGAIVTDKNQSGTISFGTADGDMIELGTTASGSYATTVVPGTYDIYYSVAVPLQATIAPLNTKGKVRSGVVLERGTPITLDIDVKTTVIDGTLEIAGMTVPQETDGGRIWLRTSYGDDLPIGWTSSGKFSARVLPGTYDVVYQGTAASNLAPRNTAAKVGCMLVE